MDKRRKKRTRLLEIQSLGLPVLFTLIAVLGTRWLGTNNGDLKLEFLNGLVGFLVGGAFLIFSRLNTLEDQLHLDQDVHRHEYLAKKLQEIAQKFKEVEVRQALSPIVEEEAGKLLDECAAKLSDLVDGTFPVESYVDRMGRLTRHIGECKSTVRATSYVSTHWWTSPAGRKYAECNYEAVKRGCVVERVFILTHQQMAELKVPNSQTNEIKKVMDEQVSKNISVYIAEYSVVEDPARGIAFSNLLVCDDEFASVNNDTPNLTGATSFTPMPATFIYDPNKVSQFITMFENLKCCAVEYKSN